MYPIPIYQKPKFNFNAYRNVYLKDEDERLRLIMDVQKDFKRLVSLNHEDCENTIICKYFGEEEIDRWERFFYNCAFDFCAKHHYVGYCKVTYNGWWNATNFVLLDKDVYGDKGHFHIQLKEDTSTVFQWWKLHRRKTKHWKFGEEDEFVMKGLQKEVLFDTETIQEILLKVKSNLRLNRGQAVNNSTFDDEEEEIDDDDDDDDKESDSEMDDESEEETQQRKKVKKRDREFTPTDAFNLGTTAITKKRKFTNLNSSQIIRIRFND